MRRIFLSFAVFCLTSSCFAQQRDDFRTSAFANVEIAPSLFDGQSDANQVEKKEQQDEKTGTKPVAAPVPRSQEQPKRILGVMPNYRAVSAGAIPPPPTLKESFNIASENSFDYSSFVFTGFTSAIADAQGAHRDLGGGVGGYWAYYWRGFVDKTDGNYLVIFALPTIFRQDERYYAMGQGPKGKRVLYAATRVLITPDYHGHNSFNSSELLGRAIAQGISTTYYPAADRTASEILSKWGYAVMRDALTNVFREFWPDIATHVLHRHP